MAVVTKRVYEKPAKDDGARILVDRLWPRGLSKQTAAIDEWLRDLAPSNELRKWFHSHPAAWTGFRKQYLKELAADSAPAALQKLYEFAESNKQLTLLFASKDEEHNNAVVLKDLLNGVRKPPTGTGPAAAGAARSRQARRVARIR